MLGAVLVLGGVPLSAYARTATFFPGHGLTSTPLRGRASRGHLARSMTAIQPAAEAPEKESTAEGWPRRGTWLPVGSVSGLTGLGPTRVELAERMLAVWQDGNGEWSVVSDTCPHRLAPLSQGRVDPSTGCLECPYHGHATRTPP